MTAAGTAELDAAGITDPRLRNDYAGSRELAARHGRTYFLGTRFLPPERRPAIHALYGFARTADDIVDDHTHLQSVAAKQEQLQRYSAELRSSDPTEPTIRAVLHTADRYDLDPALFEAFLESMRMDLTVTEFATWDDLQHYVYGSAAVIGLMVLPVLGTVVPRDRAAPFAADLGVAFQVTNFLRDVGEDAQLGRVYLPMDSLRRFGVDRGRLDAGVVDDGMRDLLAFEIARTRDIYRRAEPGIAMLEPRARACVQVAYDLYSRILGEIEKADYQVFDRRVTVTRARRLVTAGAALGRGVASGSARRLRGVLPGGDRGAPRHTTSA